MDLTEARVIVTRAPHQADGLIALLEAAGAEVLHLPTIDIGPPDSWDAADDALRELSSFDRVAFTSLNAAEGFLTRAEELGVDLHDNLPRVAAVGKATEERLTRSGLTPDLIPERSSAAALADGLGPGAGRSVLVPRAADVPDAMRRILEAASWDVVEVPVYRTVTGTPDAEVLAEVRAGRFDAVTFTSGSTVEGFVTLVGRPAALGLDGAAGGEKVVACIGPETAEAARTAGFRVDVTAREQSARGLVQALAWDD
jgi:uroporphyrinogen III methyltransferase/synthase